MELAFVVFKVDGVIISCPCRAIEARQQHCATFFSDNLRDSEEIAREPIGHCDPLPLVKATLDPFVPRTVAKAFEHRLRVALGTRITINSFFAWFTLKGLSLEPRNLSASTTVRRSEPRNLLFFFEDRSCVEVNNNITNF